MPWFVWLLLGVGGLLVCFYAAACVFLARLFTGTHRAWTWPLRISPGDFGVSHEDVIFHATDGLRISGWWLNGDGPTAVIMIPGGGLNRLNDNIQFSEPTTVNLQIASRLTAAGHSVLMYDPRATGGSEGNRVSYGCLEARDLVGALEWLERRGFESQRVAVLGWSMGCATAMWALRERTYAGLIADSALGGYVVDDVVNYVGPALRMPHVIAKTLVICFMHSVFFSARTLWGMRLADQPVEHLRANPIPTVVIHGTADKQVPVRTGQEVARAAGDRLLAAHYLEGLDHMDAVVRDPEWYMTTILGALEQMFNQQDERAPAAQLHA